MYTIKATQYSIQNGSLTGVDSILYTSTTQNTRPVPNARGSLELNEGGSVEFSLVYGHPLYGQLEPMKSYISVTDDSGDEIFYGRIISKSDPTFTGLINYQAEGSLNFLKDSEIPPEERDSQGKLKTRTMTAEQFFLWCISVHNGFVGNDPRRKLLPGTISATKKSEERSYQISSYTETKNALSQYITGVYGGFLRVRKSNGEHYIDWIQDYGVLDPQEITIGENVTALTNTTSADGFYTVLRPVGSNGLLLDSPEIDLFSASEMALYGRIVKSVNFNDCDTKAKLQQKATDFVDQMDHVVPREVSIQLIDMHYLDGTVPKIHLGDQFDNIHGASGITFTVGHVDYDFVQPENDAFSFRNKNDLDSANTGSMSGSGGISKSSARSSAGYGMSLKYYTEGQDTATIFAKEIYLHGEAIQETADNYTRLSRVVDNTITTVEYMYGTAVIQNSSAIANVAGSFELVNDFANWNLWAPNTHYAVGAKVRQAGYDGVGYICTQEHTSSDSFSTDKPQYWQEQTGWKAVRLLDGAELEVSDGGGGGVMVTVGSQLAYAYDKTSEMYGSALWSQRDGITAVNGQFDIQNEYYEDLVEWTASKAYLSGARVKVQTTDETGTYWAGYTCNTAHTSGASFDNTEKAKWTRMSGRKHVKIRSGGGMKLEDGNAEFGVYMTKTGENSAILSAGVIATIVNGSPSTFINGEHIYITGNTKFSDQVTVDNGSFAVKTALYVYGSEPANNVTINNGKISAPEVQIKNGGTLKFVGGGTGEYYDLTTTVLKSMVKSFTVSGSVLTLTPFYGDPVSFEKAVTLSGEWGSEVGLNSVEYTVTATTGQITGSAPDTTVYLRVEGNTPIDTTAYAKLYCDTVTTANMKTSRLMTLAENTESRFVELYTGDKSASPSTYMQKAVISTVSTFGAGYDSGVTAGQSSMRWFEAWTETVTGVYGNLTVGRTTSNIGTHTDNKNYIVTGEVSGITWTSTSDKVFIKASAKAYCDTKTVMSTEKYSDQITADVTAGTWTNGAVTVTSKYGIYTLGSTSVNAPTVTISGGSWSNGTMTVNATHGTKNLGTNVISAPTNASVTAGTWTNGAVTATAKHGTYTLGSGTINAPTVTISFGTWTNGTLAVNAKHGTTNLGSNTANAPTPTITCTCSDLGSSTQKNGQPIYITAKHGTHPLVTDQQQLIYIGQSGWSSGSKTVAARMSTDTGAVIDRVQIDVPSPSLGSNTTTKPSGTSLKTVKVGTGGRHTYFNVSCGGKTFGYVDVEY